MTLLALTPPPPPAPPPPARLLIFGDEFRFTLSRRLIPAGRVRIQLRNIGEDDHDLAIVGPAGKVRNRIRLIRPGQLREIRTRLVPGRYRLVCAVSDHAHRGMRASLRVTRRAGGVR